MALKTTKLPAHDVNAVKTNIWAANLGVYLQSITIFIVIDISILGFWMSFVTLLKYPQAILRLMSLRERLSC